MVRMLCLSQPSLVQVPSVLTFLLICESQLAEVMAEAMAEVDDMVKDLEDILDEGMVAMSQPPADSPQ